MFKDEEIQVVMAADQALVMFGRAAGQYVDSNYTTQNHRETDQRSRTAPKINAGSYQHSLEDGFMSQRDDDILSAYTSITVPTGSFAMPIYGYEQKALCKDTDCPFVHDRSETCEVAALRLSKVN